MLSIGGYAITNTMRNTNDEVNIVIISDGTVYATNEKIKGNFLNHRIKCSEEGIGRRLWGH